MKENNVLSTHVDQYDIFVLIERVRFAEYRQRLLLR